MTSRALVSMLVAMTAGTTIASAQTLSFARDDRPAFAGARAIVSVDLNRDGWIDLATANTGRNTVTVLRNNGAAGGFTVLRDTPVGAGPFAMAAGDLDRDGVPDLVVTTPDANAIEILYGRADGTLRSRVTLTGTGASRGVALADMTRDGRVDLVYTDYDRNVVFIRPGTDTGVGTALPPIAIDAHPQDVAAADFNHDGYLDLAVASTGAARLTVLYGQVAGTYARVNLTAPAPLNVLAVADLNNDGWVDVAAASTAADRIVLYRDGPAGLAITSMASGASPRGLAVADVNRDGRLDVLAANRGSSTVTLWLGIAGSALSFTRWGELPAGSGTRAVTAADLDHDGRIDFATGNEYAAKVTQYSNDTAFPRGAFAFSRQDLGLFYAESRAIADFNHNGRYDLVGDDRVLLDGTTTLPLPVRAPSQGQTLAVAVADVNLDGRDDVIVAEPIAYVTDQMIRIDGVTVMLGDGHGGFVRGAGYDDLPQPHHLRTADMNRDGRPDIIVAAYDGHTGQGIVCVLLVGADGTLTARRTLVAGAIDGFRVADLDRNGTLDVIAAHDTPHALTLLRGDGRGGFVDQRQIALPQPAYDVAVTDLNLDGRPDLVTNDGPTVTVRLGTGTLAWGEPASYPVVARRGAASWPAPPHSLEVADLTHDGVPDVLIPSMSILPGRPDGTLAPTEEFAAWGGDLVVDWNHDGLLDVVAGGSLVLLNVPERANTPPVARIDSNFLTEAGPIHVYGYQEQFFGFSEDHPGLLADASSDADLHALEFEWQDATGRTLGYGSSYALGTPDPLPPGDYTIWLVARDRRGGEGRASFAITILPYKEIVLWPGQFGDQVSPGAWQSVDDGTAAGERRLWYPNANAPKVVAPAATPAAYVDYYFTPDPTQTYKLWVREKAQNNSPYNDSVWLQFSGAATVSGQPAYRIGTTSGLAINLEECAGCGLSGWGWEDDGWGAVNRNGVLLRFPSGGMQRVRVQVREDGVSVDQIVLSAKKYLTSRPGTAKNDTTILLETQFYNP